MVNSNMNSILLDSKNLLKEGNYLLEVEDRNKEIDLEIEGEVVVNVFSRNSNISLNIVLKEDSKLFLETFTIDGTMNINTTLYKNSNFRLNNSVLTSKDSNNNINVLHKEERSISNIKKHGFSKDKAKLVFNVEGKVEKDAGKCTCNQDNQIIENEGSFSTILPKLLIDNYDVDANHAAYVGEFKENELFYLQSRGISLEDSKFLLLDAFLLGYFDLDNEYKSKLKEIVLEYFDKEV